MILKNKMKCMLFWEIGKKDLKKVFKRFYLAVISGIFICHWPLNIHSPRHHQHFCKGDCSKVHTHALCLVCLIVCHWWQHRVLFLWDQRRVAAPLNLPIRCCSCHLSLSLSVASLHRITYSLACISPSIFYWQSVHPLYPPSLSLWLIRIGGRGTLE